MLQASSFARSHDMIWRTLTLLLGVLFLFAGGTKLIGTQMHVEHFALWGYPSWFRVFVGAWEVGCGLLLLVPRYSFYAAVCLVVAMIGAVYTEAFRGTPAMALTPAVLLVLLTLVAYRRRPGHRTSRTPAS
jgi:putative oxidoreductase